MSLIIYLLIIAIIVPALALVGHLYVAYAFAPDRAKRAILDALSFDDDFQNDLVRSLLANLFKEVQEGDHKIIPIDMIISRAKLQFSDWIKSEMPKMADSTMSQIMPSQTDEYGNPVQNFAMNAVLSQIPKKYRGYVMMALQYWKP